MQLRENIAHRTMWNGYYLFFLLLNIMAAKNVLCSAFKEVDTELMFSQYVFEIQRMLLQLFRCFYTKCNCKKYHLIYCSFKIEIAQDGLSLKAIPSRQPWMDDLTWWWW